MFIKDRDAVWRWINLGMKGVWILYDEGVLELRVVLIACMREQGIRIFLSIICVRDLRIVYMRISF